MKHLLLLFTVIIFIFSCKKKELDKTETITIQPFVECGTKDPSLFEYQSMLRSITTRASRVASFSTPYIVYLDFDGETVTSDAWTGGGTPIVAAPSTLSAAAKAQVVTMVQDKFYSKVVHVTTNIADYNGVPMGRRTHCIIGNGLTQYLGAVGGLSFIGMGTYPTQEEPNFVLADNLGNVPKSVALAVAHESGHNLGLAHQSLWSTTAPCTRLNSYHTGIGGSAIESWVPIMGVNYGSDIASWNIGNSPYTSGQPFPNCATQQNDFTILDANLDYKVDQCPNMLPPTPATPGYITLARSATWLWNTLEAPGDNDIFKFTGTGSFTIEATSFGVLDLQVDIYRKPTFGNHYVFVQTISPVGNKSIPATAFNIPTNQTNGGAIVIRAALNTPYCPNYGLLTGRYDYRLY